MAKIKKVKNLRIKFEYKSNLSYLLNHIETIQHLIEKMKAFEKIDFDNYNEFIEEFECFERLLNDRRFHKYIPDKYFDIFEDFEDDKYSDAKYYKKQDEFNYCKYELGYTRNQLMNRFCDDY